MTAPPPIPNRPAMMPVSTPPPAMAAARTTSSPIGTPDISTLLSPGTSPGTSRGRRLSQCGAACKQTERLAQHLGAGTRLDRCDGKVAAERARARRPMEQAHHMAKDCTCPHAGGGLALHIGDQGFG